MAAAVAAPAVVVVVLAWPEGGDADRGGRDGRGEVLLDVGELSDGQELDVEVPASGAARLTIVGRGDEVTVRAEGRRGFDSTLTLLDADGEQVAFNDDAADLDPALSFELDDGESATIEVRSFGGVPGDVAVIREDGSGEEPSRRRGDP
jgi:hypothetical protein